jgi:hypothetical protein
MDADDDWLALDAIIHDPVKRALQKQMKDLGWRLYRAVGNTDAMRNICLEIAGQKPRYWEYRVDVMDKNWDGVGDDNDRWWS